VTVATATIFTSMTVGPTGPSPCRFVVRFANHALDHVE
jgi:hypothetical protein